MAVASFADAAAWRAAATCADDGRWRIVGLWSPYPVELPGTRASAGIVAVAAAVGLLAAAGFVAFEWWTAAILYRFDAGGRPLASWGAFLVAPVEAGALAAGIAGAVMLIVRARLGRLHHPAFDLPEVEWAQRDRFALALACDAGENANAALAMLAEAGADHTRLVTR